MEKRACERQYCEGNIACTSFNSNFGTNQYRPAKVLNYSQDGIYFESDYAFKPRTYIFLRGEGKSSQSANSSQFDCFRTAAVGEVKWCNETSSDSFYKYGFGLKYCEPYL